MRKTDINKYRDNNGMTFDNYIYKNNGKLNENQEKTCIYKSLGKMFMSFMKTFLLVMIITGIIVSSSLIIYIVRLSNDKLVYDLTASKLRLTSIVYVNDENGNFNEYQNLYDTENRIWVDFDDIPNSMKNAVIAIEDKRFMEHNGVDWTRTVGAVLSLAKGKSSYGGSTLTQQLIKNLTDDSEVSITRKIREIMRALNYEKKYSKDEILEAYLNVVNFGSGCRGVQAAANLYFGKDISECSIAECAAIAGITQNPSAYTPLVYPENNKIRRETVLTEMYSQGMITKDEYDQAIEESQNMQFINNDIEDDDQHNTSARNWYIETLCNDIINDLSSELNIGKNAAEEMLLTQGLKIYCAMDVNAQNAAESVIRDSSLMPADTSLELGYVMMGFDGRILATLGCREEKTGDLWFDKANVAKRQPGSIIKPIAIYAPAIDLGMYNYSSIIPDEPLHNIDIKGDGNLSDWPSNWYGGYRGRVTLQWAIEKSANAPAAQVLAALTPKKSYKFLTEKLGFTSLDTSDMTYSALATGGTTYGVTVREMTAAFQIFGNGGLYNKPYTYFYVMDQDDNILLDNRENIPTQAISSKTATIMNRLLRQVIIGAEGTGRAASISGWNVIGKTGTTTDDYDSWFIGETPYAVAGIWTGYDDPKTIAYTSAAANIWKNIMIRYLQDKQLKDYTYDSAVVERTYCKQSGKLANSAYCASTAKGYYASNNLPATCDGSHTAIQANAKVEDSSSMVDSSASQSSSSNSDVSKNVENSEVSKKEG